MLKYKIKCMIVLFAPKIMTARFSATQDFPAPSIAHISTAYWRQDRAGPRESMWESVSSAADILSHQSFLRTNPDAALLPRITRVSSVYASTPKNSFLRTSTSFKTASDPALPEVRLANTLSSKVEGNTDLVQAPQCCSYYPMRHQPQRGKRSAI